MESGAQSLGFIALYINSRVRISGDINCVTYKKQNIFISAFSAFKTILDFDTNRKCASSACITGVSDTFQKPIALTLHFRSQQSAIQ